MEQTQRASPHVAIDSRKLKLARQLRGLSQNELARLSTVDQSLISKLERGARLHLSAPFYAKLCDALGVTDRTTLMAQSPATTED